MEEKQASMYELLHTISFLSSSLLTILRLLSNSVLLYFRQTPNQQLSLNILVNLAQDVGHSLGIITNVEAIEIRKASPFLPMIIQSKIWNPLINVSTSSHDKLYHFNLAEPKRIITLKSDRDSNHINHIVIKSCNFYVWYNLQFKLHPSST